MKVVINSCFGGFSLSPDATLWLWEHGCKSLEVTHIDEYWPLASRDKDSRSWVANSKYFGFDNALAEWRKYLASAPRGKRDTLFLHVFTPDEQYVISTRKIERNDPLLVKVVEELGEKANGACAELEVIEIPDDVKWHIEEYDGREHIAEDHRTWG